MLFIFIIYGFDGSFILDYLLKHDYKYIEQKDEKENRTFNTIISDLGEMYSIDIYFEKNIKVKLLDSYKLIPFKVKEIPKYFGLDIQKLELDYNLERKNDHEFTKDEIEYITNDVVIVAKALEILFKEGLKKMTRASCALEDYKKTIGNSKFERLFPCLNYDEFMQIRECYKGGFTYLNPEYSEKQVKNGTVLDVNSLYPYVMRNFPMCYGKSIYFDGKYEIDTVYDLYIQVITCSFELKPNKLPTIQIKGMKKFFHENEYLTSSEGKRITLCLTNVDLELFLKHYYIYDEVYEHGWKYRSLKNGMMFDNYIDKWIERKINASKENNQGIRTLCKLMLNSLYR